MYPELHILIDKISYKKHSNAQNNLTHIKLYVLSFKHLHSACYLNMNIILHDSEDK